MAKHKEYSKTFGIFYDNYRRWCREMAARGELSDQPEEQFPSFKSGYGWQRPEGMCESAWESISPFVMTLAHGGENIYDGWMRNPKSAMISCNDGFRPVSFLIEVMDEKQE